MSSWNPERYLSYSIDFSAAAGRSSVRIPAMCFASIHLARTMMPVLLRWLVAQKVGAVLRLGRENCLFRNARLGLKSTLFGPNSTLTCSRKTGEVSQEQVRVSLR